MYELFKRAVCPVATYCAETWFISRSAEKTVMTLERNILRKIFESMLESSQ
jgi:hypothetical protein